MGIKNRVFKHERLLCTRPLEREIETLGCHTFGRPLKKIVNETNGAAQHIDWLAVRHIY